MNRMISRFSVLSTVAILASRALSFGESPVPPAQEKLVYATDAPKPRTPAESQATFKLPPGFHIELVAAEPRLAEPNGICFDARGRIFVSELHGYNLDGYYDILDLNKTGVLDKAVRRIPASRSAQLRAEKETYGTVRMLTTDASGRVTASSVFADHLPPCYGVVPARDGVIVMCAPDIIYLGDSKGTGHADVRETLFTGFGVGEMWTRISNPRWCFDNWIYAATGASSAGTIRGPHLKGEVKLGRTCFRFKLDGSQFEPVSGGTEGFGLAIDDWGDRFVITNQQHALHVTPLAYNDLMRNPFCPAPNAVENICTYGHPAQLYPTSSPDPWRRQRAAQPEWVRFYGAAETTNGLFTSACSPTIYQADQFPPEYRGNQFSCEPAQNLIHRCLLVPDGAGFKANRATEGQEFLASTETWFRPVSLTVGPEGALYVVDMYREIIEDFSAIPRYLQQQYVESLHNGFDKGRIWRVVYGNAPASADADLAHESDDRLMAELASPNVWRRLTAQRLIVERQDKSLAPALEKLFHSSPTAVGRLHALYTLDGLDRLPTRLVDDALRDAEPGVRINALKLAAPRFDAERSLLTTALATIDDPSAKVRLQLACALGDTKDARALSALATLTQREGENRWVQAAVLSSTPTRSAQLVGELLKSSRPGARAMLQPLAAVVGARNQDDEVSACLAAVASLTDSEAATLQLSILNGLIDGLRRNRVKQPMAGAGERALESLLHSHSTLVASAALQLAGLIKHEDSRILSAARGVALATALSDGPVKERLAALTSLGGSPYAILAKLAPLLEVHEPLEIQLAAIQAIGSAESPDVVALLVKNWNERSPTVQAAILDAICARRDRFPLLLDAIADKSLDAASISPIRQAQLLENSDPKIRERARSLLTAAANNEERRRALDQYRPALTLPRHPDQGRAVFERTCFKCHQLNGRGNKVGPDLAAVQDRTDESILIDILDPSATIAAGYRAYTVTTTSGKMYTGVMASETATSVTLRRELGAEDTILRKDVDAIVGMKKSLMPEGLEKEITPQQMADLIGYLRVSLQKK